jgi:hypothetical protein
MITFASKHDIEKIVSLWKICFGDEENYIRRFINRFMTNQSCLVYKNGSDLLSFLFLLESKIVISGERYQARYIYAACTAPESRNKGIMSKMMEYSVNDSVSNNIDFLCLVPASSALFDYYARFGFKPAFKRKEFVLNRNLVSIISNSDAHACLPAITDIKALRDVALAEVDCLIWEEGTIEYAIKENELYGGSTVFAEKDGSLIGYSLFSEVEDRLHIKELCVTTGNFGALMGVIMNLVKSKIFEFSLPIVTPISTDSFTIRDNGMIKALNSKAICALNGMSNAYIGLTLE